MFRPKIHAKQLELEHFYFPYFFITTQRKQLAGNAEGESLATSPNLFFFRRADVFQDFLFNSTKYENWEQHSDGSNLQFNKRSIYSSTQPDSTKPARVVLAWRSFLDFTLSMLKQQ